MQKKGVFPSLDYIKFLFRIIRRIKQHKILFILSSPQFYFYPYLFTEVFGENIYLYAKHVFSLCDDIFTLELQKNNSPQKTAYSFA